MSLNPDGSLDQVTVCHYRLKALRLAASQISTEDPAEIVAAAAQFFSFIFGGSLPAAAPPRKASTESRASRGATRASAT